ncbi:hypothetical protein C8N46_1177 [Kordia periserrulae]|uniref:Uncharacterized protein n=1 Tax=Kordia periserrulae TaxID=701523 RepID=A0A2T6BQ62_9FLAO|nr:hypothetical protein [Kordia periserrulae]PTX58231.1 hypothetical protein C8N46_1177 [Kordia periserrulae]
MRKQILNLGKVLSKSEQKQIFGGFDDPGSHYTVTCSAGGGGNVNSIDEANDLIKKCWAKGGTAMIRSND